MSVIASPVFEQFIAEKLISTGVVSGALLLSRHGQVLFKYGELKHTLKTDHTQFLLLFDVMSDLAPDHSHQHELTLSSSAGHKTTYKVYQKTYSSVYGTCCSGNGGITVCNLPYGVLICTYNAHTRTGDAVKAIEKFCDAMRK